MKNINRKTKVLISTFLLSMTIFVLFFTVKTNIDNNEYKGKVSTNNSQLKIFDEPEGVFIRKDFYSYIIEVGKTNDDVQLSGSIQSINFADAGREISKEDFSLEINSNYINGDKPIGEKGKSPLTADQDGSPLENSDYEIHAYYGYDDEFKELAKVMIYALKPIERDDAFWGYEIITVNLPTKLDGFANNSIDAEKLEVVDFSNTSGVYLTDATSLFEDATALNTVSMWWMTSISGDLVNLNTSRMFYNCSSLTTIIDKHFAFDFKRLIDLSYMFAKTSSLISLDLSEFDGGSAKNIDYMFLDSAITNLTFFNAINSGLEIINAPFKNTKNLKYIDMKKFTLSNIRDISQLFDGISNLDYLHIPRITSIKLTSINNLFEGKTIKKLDMTGFEVSAEISMEHTFKNAVIDELILYYKYGRITNLNNTFENLTVNTLNMKEFNITYTTEMSSAFSTLNDVVNIYMPINKSFSLKNLDYLFQDLTTLKLVDMSGMDFNALESMNYLFKNSGVETVKMPVSSGKSLSLEYLFEGANNLKSIDLSNFDISKTQNITKMFKGSSLNEIVMPSRSVSTGITDMSNTFADLPKLQKIDFTNFKTPNLLTVNDIFARSTNISQLTFTEGFIGTNITDLSQMFMGLNKLTTLDISSFDMSEVVDMSDMFSGCTMLVSLNIKLPDQNKLQSTSRMFDNCNALRSFDFTTFNTNNVTDFTRMFKNNYELANVTTSSNMFVKAITVEKMFLACKELKEISFVNTNALVLSNMNGMFSNCTNLETILLGINTSDQLKDLTGLFFANSSLTNVTFSNNFITKGVRNYSNIFDGVTLVKSLDLSSFELSASATYTAFVQNIVSLEQINTPKVIESGIKMLLLPDSFIGELQTYYTEHVYTELSNTSQNLLLKKAVELRYYTFGPIEGEGEAYKFNNYNDKNVKEDEDGEYDDYLEHIVFIYYNDKIIREKILYEEVEGLELVGWTTSIGSNKLYDFETIVKEDLVLVAFYREELESIDPAQLQWEFNEYTYDGQEITFLVDEVALSNTIYGIVVKSYSNNVQTNAGTYDVTIELDFDPIYVNLLDTKVVKKAIIL
ncbi:MAG: BspA family leucine-rich repeat surface protein, partial [Anaeroplasmataceae bacterium]